MTDTLIERLEAAEGPSVGLDAWIYLDVDTSIGMVPTPAYTSSLDAAVALVERFDRGWCLERGGAKDYAAQVSSHGEYIGWHVAEANTPALALCIALLKALEARDE